MAVTYDLALPILVDLIVDAWGISSVARNLFLRDAAGRLTFVVLEQDKDGQTRESLSAKINTRLDGYADPSGISVATPEELFDERLRDTNAGYLFPIKGGEFKGTIRLVDRRVVGGDWLRAPTGAFAGPSRLFFVSLKGGVGRSTALCVLAAHLASSGQRVLAIDLDLEAPGLGTMLLDAETIPKFGVLDYLVETNISNVDDLFVSDMLGASKLSAGRGVINVIPALGALTTAYSENTLSKIARAYLSSDVDQLLSSFTLKIEKLIDITTKTGGYDVVLVDARAGLHESTAAAAVALRGDTLLFGIDQPQTYAGYKALFSQLAVTLGHDWASQIHFVEARVGAEGPSREFVSNMVEVMPEGIDVEMVQTIPLEELRNTFDVDWDEKTPTSISEISLKKEIDSTFIYESDVFRSFDPLKRPDRLDQGAYAAVFKNFLEKCDEILRASELTRQGAGNVER